MWKNLVQPDCGIIRRLAIVCLIKKDTDINSDNEIILAYAQKIWLRERTSMLRLSYIVCL
jgi:hypothetical protein